MNILICIPCLQTGGTEIQTLSLVKALVTSGHRVTTVCYFEHTAEMIKRYQQAGSEVFCFSLQGIRPNRVLQTMRFLFKGFRQQLRKDKYDIAHVQYMAPGAIPIILLRLLGIKTIIATAHTTADIYPSLKLLHFLQRNILTAFICITLKAEESFFGTSQLFSPNIKLKKRGNHFTIYNCLPDFIKIANEPRENRDSITIGIVGSLELIKGMDLVVPAFTRIHKKHPNTHLIVIGEGSLHTLLEQQIQDNHLEESVTFKGCQPQELLQDIYDQIDILLVPSRSEGFGLTALEGMARGCIVVAANVGGLPEIIENNKTGLIYNSSYDLAPFCSKLILNKQLLRTYSLAAIKRSASFSYDKYFMSISEIYKRIENLCK